MDTARANDHKGEKYILKSNLWKFFKALRAQANPIYCLLVASPIDYAWISIHDKADPANQRRITISQFINSLKKMPSTNKRYRLSIRLYDTSAPEADRNSIYEATCPHHLSIELVCSLFSLIVSFHCVEAAERGDNFELTPQVIGRYKFKARYVEKLQTIIDNFNNSKL